MITNTALTIFRSEYNPDTGLDEIVRTFVPAASWYAVKGSTIGSMGQTGKDGYYVRIPVRHLYNYIPPAYFADSTLEGKWTIKTGDKVIRGSVELTEGQTLGDIERTHEEVFTVTGYADDRRGDLQHLKVVGE